MRSPQLSTLIPSKSNGFEQERERIDLVLTDVVLPGISGPEMATRLKSLRPQVKVLYMSGYTADKLAGHSVLDTHFISKPFTPAQLTTTVRQILENGDRTDGRDGVPDAQSASML